MKIVSNLMPIGGRPGKRERISTRANNEVASQLKAVKVGGRRSRNIEVLRIIAAKAPMIIVNTSRATDILKIPDLLTFQENPTLPF